MAQRSGFEPEQGGLEAPVLPLHYRCIENGATAQVAHPNIHTSGVVSRNLVRFRSHVDALNDRSIEIG